MSLLKQSSICLSVFLLLSLSMGQKISHQEGGFVNYFKNLFSMHKIKPVRSYTLYGKTDGPVDAGAGLPDITPPKEFKELAEYVRHLAFRKNLRNSVIMDEGNRAYHGVESIPSSTNSLLAYNRVVPSTMSNNNNNNNQIQRNQILPQYYPSFNWYPNQGIPTGQVLRRQNEINNNNNNRQQPQYLRPIMIPYPTSSAAMNQLQLNNKLSLHASPMVNWKQSSVRTVQNPISLNNNVHQQNTMGKESSTSLKVDTNGNTVQSNESSFSGSNESESNTATFPLEHDSQIQMNYNDDNEINDDKDMASLGDLTFDTIRYSINSDDDLLSTD